MSAREVITIQCGHFSNFIGTHWWNIQVVSWSAMTVRPYQIDLMFHGSGRVIFSEN